MDCEPTFLTAKEAREKTKEAWARKLGTICRDVHEKIVHKIAEGETRCVVTIPIVYNTAVQRLLKERGFRVKSTFKDGSSNNLWIEWNILKPLFTLKDP